MSKYILDENDQPVQTDWKTHMQFWGDPVNDPRRKLADDYVGIQNVSTVFLCMSLNPPMREPLLYETMVFGGPLDGLQMRAPTRVLALECHARVLGMVEGQMIDVTPEQKQIGKSE